MLSHTLLTLALAGAASAQNRPNWRLDRPTPRPNANPTDTNDVRLIGKRFAYNELPYKVDTAETARGIQVGFNQCNATTAGENSMCQTLIVNSIDDFCLFIPPTVMPVGNAEAGMVVACTKEHGGRRIPAGALTAVQFLKTPSYLGIAGRINQQLLNLPAGDQGGEVDSGGQDQRGNPIGGVTYSNQLPGTEGTYTQSIVWTQFIGGDRFCLKACTPTAPDAADMCEHVYDTIGCDMNFPAAYAPNVFESCDADDARPVGELVELNTVILHASSNCRAHQSAELYAGLPSGGNGNPSQTTTSRSSAPTTTSGSGNPRPPTSGSSTSSGAASPTPTDAAVSRLSFGAAFAVIPVVAGLVGAILV